MLLRSWLGQRMQFVRLKRREFITLVGGAGVAWPLAARAQQGALPVIGFLNAGSAAPFEQYIEGFRQGLSETGYVDGRDVAIDFRWAEGRYDRLPTLAADLVQRRVALIVVSGGAVSASAAKAATLTIPIIFVIGDDPVKTGLVSSLSRPGGNLTGMTLFISTLMAKRFELLHEMLPASSDIAVMVNPKNPNAEADTNEIQRAARSRGQVLRVIDASTENEIDSAFQTLVEQRIDALLLGTDPFFYSQRDRFVMLAEHRRIPTIYFVREFTRVGGLMSYGPNFVNEWRQAGQYAARIIKGAKPSELPVLQPSKFELVINLKTAKVLGLDVPPTLLATADEVIE
jgi:putative tryptophan/tyrosine transport system substrate-binding protein